MILSVGLSLLVFVIRQAPDKIEEHEEVRVFAAGPSSLYGRDMYVTFGGGDVSCLGIFDSVND